MRSPFLKRETNTTIKRGLNSNLNASSATRHGPQPGAMCASSTGMFICPGVFNTRAKYISRNVNLASNQDSFTFIKMKLRESQISLEIIWNEEFSKIMQLS
jgi:hypothetical protein